MTVEDLYKTPGKAVLVDGELLLMPPTVGKPGEAAFAIVVSLREHACRIGRGRAVPSNIGFLVNLPHRNSFSPDVAFWMVEAPSMGFYEGARLAVEVRSEND